MRRLFDIGASLVRGESRQSYQIGERVVVEEGAISEGGFAFVVRARDVHTGDVFALKKLRCQDSESLAAAKREAEILENLPSHKNIVGYWGHAVFGHNEIDDGTLRTGEKLVLILLELCPGGHLLDLLDKHKGILRKKVLVKVFTDIAEAVFCLHSNTPPIQHRDLKLENVLLGSDGFWKLVDFGSWSDQQHDLTNLSTRDLKALAEELEQHTTMMYRPPEMVDIYQRLPINRAVDMWMLGCILYSLMFNRHPFQDAAAFAIRNAQYIVPHRDPPWPEKLLDLLIWLLAQNPQHRPTSRQLVRTLWQWDDADQLLELPQEVVETKRRLLRSAVGDSKSMGSGTKAKQAAKSGAVSSNGKQSGQSFAGNNPAKAQAAVVETVAAMGESWVAFADTPGGFASSDSCIPATLGSDEFGSFTRAEACESKVEAAAQELVDTTLPPVGSNGLSGSAPRDGNDESSHVAVVKDSTPLESVALADAATSASAGNEVSLATPGVNSNVSALPAEAIKSQTGSLDPPKKPQSDCSEDGCPNFSDDNHTAAVSSMPGEAKLETALGVTPPNNHAQVDLASTQSSVNAQQDTAP